MNESAPDPSRLLQVGMGFLASKALLSAVELGVFVTLGRDAMTGEDLRGRIGLHPRAAFDFLDALVALGFLHRAGHGPEARCSNTPETAAFLDPASPTYLGDTLHMANNRLYRHWGNPTEALRTGLPQNERKSDPSDDAFASLHADPGRLVEFLDAMAGVQLGNCRTLVERFDFARFPPVCDVGGASGALSIAIARRHPTVRCISYDLPVVTNVARERIAASGLADRVGGRAGDFLVEALPTADVITMGSILHDWGTATKQTQLRKAYAALSQGGAFIAIENIIDDARRENAHGLLMSLNMLIETSERYDYTFAQFDSWCRGAGFRRTERVAPQGPSSAAVAWR